MTAPPEERCQCGRVDLTTSRPLRVGVGGEPTVMHRVGRPGTELNALVPEVEYGATSPEFMWKSRRANQEPTVPFPPSGTGWEFLAAVCDEGCVVWYWKRQSPPARPPHSP